MSFDPTLPANHSPIVSPELRDQFNGLKSLIDAQQTTIDSQQSAITALQSQTQAQTQEIADVQDVVSALQTRCP